MKILFLTASRFYPQNISINRHIEKTILQLGHVATPANCEATLREFKGEEANLDTEDWTILCNRVILAASECDMAVLDVTDKAAFGIGYCAHMVLQRNKPLLFLMRKGSMHGSFITGLQHPRLTRQTFDETNVGDIITQFVTRAKEK